MIKKFDRWFLGVLIGFVPPVLLSLICWWGSLPFFSDSKVTPAIILGFVTGIGIDLVFLKKWVSQGYDLGRVIQVFVYFFYSIGIFGFFMGFPAFNVLSGIFAGVFTGRKLALQGTSGASKLREIRRVSLFTALMIFVFSVSSGWLAVRDPYTAANLEGMLKLSFAVTQNLVYGIILVGGVLLVIIQYWLTRLFAALAMRIG